MKANLLKSLFVIFALLCFGHSMAKAAGELDPTFTASAYGLAFGNVNVVRTQADGKVLVGGFFSDVNGFAGSGISRLNADGTTDKTFLAPDFFGPFGTGSQVYSIAVQSDGKILVGGDFYGANGVVFPGLRRLNSDGTIDPTFTINQIGNGSIVSDIEILADGKILTGGSFLVSGKSNLARLNSDGTIDMSFTANSSIPSVQDIAVESATGKYVVVGAFGIKRFLADGNLDPAFTEPFGVSGVEAVAIAPDGKYIIGGSFTIVNNAPQVRIARINTDGSVDFTFNQNLSGPNSPVKEIEIRPNGKIMIGGTFSTFNGSAAQRVAQLNSDGTFDSSFTTGSALTNATVMAIKLLPDGSIYVGIQGNTALRSLQKFDIAGMLDTTFRPSVNRTGNVQKIVVQPDGKVLVCGWFPLANGVDRRSIARFNTDGSLDTTFVPYVNAEAVTEIAAISLQPDGKILLGFSFGARGIVRMNSDGTKDLTFTPNDIIGVRDIVVLPTGQILVAGTSIPNILVRLSSSGVRDETFATGLDRQVNKIVVQPDGQILIAGEFTNVNGFIRNRIARLNGSNGSIDNSFNPPSGANGTVFDLDLQADGKILLGGSFTSLNGSTNQMRIGRMNANGTLDTSFVQTTNADIFAVKVQPDGKILIGGSMSIVGSTAKNGIARLNSNGSLDPAFTTVAQSSVFDIQLQQDGKILIGGEFARINFASAVRLARLENVIAPQRTKFDFDGDGKADISVYRPGTGRWYEFLSATNTVSESAFGAIGDISVPSDFDGDGKTDEAIFRPSTGDWWYQSSINNAQIQNNWGQDGDIPRPSDFDGDGRDDFVVFRPSTNTWLRYGAGGASNIVFGSAGDQPLIGDFDGDGKSDPAIFRPSTGDWWYAASSAGNQFRANHWGQNGDIPVAANFDGDSMTDLAVFRPSDGGWYIRNSSNGSIITQAYGLAADRPVAGDYDGDGRADISVFRPSSGIWYIQRSTAGQIGFQWGISTDTPAEAAFLP